MNDQDKMEAILASDQVSKYILAKLFYRLMYGDLSSIGDAISEGKVILYDGGPAKNVGFVDDATCYTIKPKTIMFNGCKINAPVTWADVSLQDLVVYCATPIGVRHNYGQEVFDYIAAGVAFDNIKNAEAYRRAAGWVK
jgi:hypothetical protein